MTRTEILQYLNESAIQGTTRATHSRYLHQCLSNAEFLALDPDSHQAALVYLQSLKPHAAKRAFHVLSRFHVWRFMSGLEQSNPMRLVPKPKAIETPRLGLPRQALAAIFNQLEVDAQRASALNRFAALRQRAMVITLLYYGLRPGELLNLDLKHFDRRNSYLRVTRKGGHEVLVKLHPEVMEMLYAWLAVRPVALEGPGPLFCNRHGKRLSPQATIKNFNALCVRAGVELPRGGLHQLRHTMAQIMIERGDRLDSVAKYLVKRHINYET